MKNAIEKETLTISFDSNLTAALVPDLTREVKAILEMEPGCKRVVADLTGVEYIDSTGITLIIGMYRSIDAVNKRFLVSGAREEIKDLFSIIQLDNIFDIQ
ncbi:STAS domain-containing protein [Anoxynatronum sibiricum]|uniref:Anti-sigma factor antagonist n=1 Tax=Anoxynatronum sibiricum TaxID=210623 RepID=A0ABU9VQR9_9CLOT